jgi:arylsulfatase A-like enzyme
MTKETNGPAYRRPRTIILFALAASLLAAAACRKTPPPQNFLLITLDTQRADFLSCYGATGVQTPNLDALAAQGTLFENCYSLIPITAPSHASMFFSQPPHALKYYNNGQEFQKVRFDRDKPTLARLFKKRDFTTAAFISLGVLKSKFSLDDGFDVYEDEFPKERWYLTADEVNARVFPWLEAHRGEKFFLWVHYSDPHDPYAPPDSPPDIKVLHDGRTLGEYCLDKYSFFRVSVDIPSGKSQLRFDIANTSPAGRNSFDARLDAVDFEPQLDQKTVVSNFSWGWYLRREDNIFFCKSGATIDIVNRGKPVRRDLVFRGRLNLSPAGTRERYAREVRFLDGEIGKLFDKLKALQLFDKTAIMAVGDHGEGLGEHVTTQGLRHFGHIHFLYRDYLRVPLILYNPSSPKRGQRKSPTTTLLDVAPTVSGVMGFNNLPAYRGRDLMRLKADKDFTAFEETYKPEAIWDRFAVRRGPWHLILTPEEKLYELYNLETDPSEMANVFEENRALKAVAALKQEIDDFARGILSSKELFRIDRETEAMLKALGYVR